MTATALERFWRFVPDRPDRPDACWPWVGSMGSSPYVNPTFRHDGRCGPAARFIWTVLHGDPGGRYVRRDCRNRRCVRPAHLSLTKGPVPWERQGAWGERNTRAKLSDERVRQLRLLYERGARREQLARFFGVTPQAVSGLVNGRTRRAAGGPIREAAA